MPLFILFILLRKKLNKKIVKRVISLFPLLFFIVVINFMHGSGKVLYNIGPFYFIKQGLMRGIIYSGIVLELFFMSLLLTEGFEKIQTIAILKKFRLKRFKTHNVDNSLNNHKIDFLILIYYVLTLFKISYSNISIFFKINKKGTDKKLGEKIVQFMVKSLKMAEEEINGIRKNYIPVVTLTVFDILFVVIQFAVILASFIFRNKVTLII